MDNVWCYTIVRNECLMLPYWLRHYSQFCEKMIVYDDRSTDGTQLIAAAAGAEVRELPYTGLDDGLQVEFASRIYKEAANKAAWVMFVDADEFILGDSVPNPLLDLQKYRSWDMHLMEPVGYNMVSERMPTTHGQIYDEIRDGARDNSYSKPVILDPTTDAKWTVGRHTIQAEADKCQGLRLLHFRYLGPAYFYSRNSRNYARLPEYAREYGWGNGTYPENLLKETKRYRNLFHAIPQKV